MAISTSKSLSEVKWEITTNRFVCYIEIMGFKDRVARTTHDEIYQLMLKIDNARKMNSSIEWNNGGFKGLVKTTTFSDSLLIYSQSDNYESLCSLVCTVAAICQDLLMEGIPFRGSIAYGRMTLDNERAIVFGQPLIDAYLLQEEMCFYGIIIHGTAQEKIELLGITPFVENYNCPLKGGNSSHLTVYPIFLGDNKYKEENNKIIIALNKMRYQTSGHIRRYIDMTEEYLNFILSKESKVVK